MQKLVANLFLLSSLFCYVAPVKVIPTDIQPFYLIFGLLYLSYGIPKKVPIDFLVIAFTVLVATVILIVNMFVFDAIRSYIAYIGLLTCFVAFFKYFKDYGVPYKILEYYVYILLGISVVQKFINRDFFSYFIVSQRTSAQRGVTSAFSEPTHYGMICLFLAIIMILINHPLKKRLVTLLIIQIVGFAMSTQAMLFLLIWLIIYLILNKMNLARVAVIAFLGIIGLYSYSFLIVYFNMEDVRFVKIFDIIFNEGFLILLMADTSVADRLAHIIYSFKGAFDNFLFPNGFVVWFDYLEEMNKKYLDVLPHAGMSKIMSSLGAILFELGLFGIPLIVLLYKNILLLSLKVRKNPIEMMVVFSFIFLTAVQLTLPLYAFLLSYGCWITTKTKFLLKE
jgi:hypothetical protein